MRNEINFYFIMWVKYHYMLIYIYLQACDFSGFIIKNLFSQKYDFPVIFSRVNSMPVYIYTYVYVCTQ